MVRVASTLLIVTWFCIPLSWALAQDTVTLPPVSSPPGSVTSENPAATTGTAPINDSTPSGTATTGTSGVSMEEAARNDNYSLLWMALLALAVAGIVMMAVKRKRRQT